MSEPELENVQPQAESLGGLLRDLTHLHLELAYYLNGVGSITDYLKHCQMMWERASKAFPVKE
jgi:hypothetical protein